MELLEDFIQCEVFQTLPEGKKNLKLEEHKNLQISHIAIDSQDLPSVLPQGKRSRRLNDVGGWAPSSNCLEEFG